MTAAPDQPNDDGAAGGSLLGAMTSRRAFLAGAVATAGLSMLDPRQLAAARRRAVALPVGDLFPLGVASGDPTAQGVILWTRLISPVPATPLPPADIAVDWEVATDDAFADVVASGTAPAVAALAHSVHVDVEGLQPDTWYWYRFSADGRTSAVARTRTFPGAGATPERVVFALATCQNWSDGYYTAHAGIAAEDLDFVVFVGDYIYEKSANRQPRPISIPESVDLPTYRARYELYKGDPNLQASHHRAPWITTVDDHEVANNMIAGIGKDGEAAGDPAAIAAWLARRADAYQAWYEHQPVRLPAPSSADYRIHRVVEHSDLLRFFVLDGRQYRSGYPTGTTSEGADDPKRFDEDRTMLGAEQEAWLDQQFAATTSRWNAVAQQTVMTATPIPVGKTNFFNFDQWDGYVAARNRLLHSLVDRKVRNPMVLSGDIHLAAAGGVRLDYDDPAAPDIANEVVTTSISSRFDDGLLDLFTAALEKASWARYGNAVDRGYALITLTANEWRTDFRVVDVKVPSATVRTDHTDRVQDRDPVVLPPPTTAPPTTTAPPAGPAPATGAQPVSGAADYTG
ncbi:alkaline phosphatase D family protein [Aquihabitans sp. G128]|uniref:alkaline phosphatase D family protein n=1 Tax=Aquihabitans sp. G128 TaxID=2849779 RepID=UPI001C23F65B|nr:alkaline phosphatase D family protein [Aquihabitans sp. G128]QXC62865.1 alkaline phosphatase D family protein [Aquihabitans sp. G128]